MTKRMLIDALHPEEVRVATTNNGRLEEFDFETAAKKQIKGNIFLGKVTRVEPSLQAVFVEYGGNRQGFLPFSEIHFDYFQIPVSDKEKLRELHNLKEDVPEEDDVIDEDGEKAGKPKKGKDEKPKEKEEEALEVDKDEQEVEEGVETFDEETTPLRKFNFYRKYKVNEVIKRNQVLLVQVIKEERGNKGASLTTYISLPGRYCVFMPNALKQGGISRKITDFDTRRKLRKIISEFKTPEGSSLIVRTAGADRKKPELKRDMDYLVKLWNDIREQTLSSEAPAMIYEESEIIKRALRDMYDSDISEVLVEGEDAFKSAKEFMKFITPTHASRVKEYKDNAPIFWRYQIDDELAELHENTVSLPSGGSIVFAPTEALVAIDVNSGRSTRERSVEETAIKTNLEAATEIARQLRLRDLAGLVVIDFIDMFEFKNRRTVERALKDALRKDRAKIQVGRISTFGLLEMSRQRMRSSYVEAHTVVCPRCNGLGYVRSLESASILVLRAIESEAAKKAKQGEVSFSTSPDVCTNLLNNFRDDLNSIEQSTGVSITIQADSELMGPQFRVNRTRSQGRRKQQQSSSRRRRPDRKDDSRRDNRDNTRKESSSRKPREKNEDEGKANDNLPEEEDFNKQESRPARRDNKRRGSSRKSGSDDRGSRRKPDNRRSSGNRQKKDDFVPPQDDEFESAPRDEKPSAKRRSAKPSDAPGNAPGEEDDSVIKGIWNKITK